VLGRYSFGVGDRFAHEAQAQLRAFMTAADHGVAVTPVWNKSEREHQIVGSGPGDVRAAADAAVEALGWSAPYRIDADHIGAATVEPYLEPCDFFTLDVADALGAPVEERAVEEFLERHPELQGTVDVPGLERPLEMGGEDVARDAHRYLAAAAAAGRLYRRIANARAAGTFVTEVSMDETDEPQTPAELLVVLAALADERIPVRTIAPRFSGRFNKGVDYVGDVDRFEREFADDVAVVAFATAAWELPADLKLSVHSGSDKFSIFPAIHRVLEATGAGVHVKTSGTTWLEELIGLAEAGGDGLALAGDVYEAAYGRLDELTAPYAQVIDIDPAALPAPTVVRAWDGGRFAATVRHDPGDDRYDPNVRQLLHVGYKVAAQMGSRYTDMLAACRADIARNVTENIYERHLRPLFIGD
jgi:hypothetical protein